ncbi:MAG: hypothetical protein ACTHJR_18740 [Sphingomonas sp.]|uniref:hypothetical protein n=1 Tax=Sphingomonas sp. TaxID=28214 RepID=UPI003F7D74E9
MRDLRFDELNHVYGAGGRGCYTPPSCGGGNGSKSKKSKSHKSKSHKSKSNKSKSHKSQRYC